MNKKIKYILLTLLFAAILTIVFAGVYMSDVELAKYDVVKTAGKIEIRDYAPMIVAEVEVGGERKEAINQGFRMIADFIFGNNAPAKKVAMTTPVIQQKSEQIAMTAPVIQQKSEQIAMTAPVIQESVGDKWKVRFVMPANYTLDTLPRPNNNKVRLEEIDSKRYAVISFSGIADTGKLQRKTKELAEYVKAESMQPLSVETYAFFNPPWTLPFFRRNEVMIEIAK